MNTAVLAPHPDDETLGCGGTIFKHKEKKDVVHWIIGSCEADNESSYSYTKKTIKNVSDFYGFDSVSILNFTPSMLDTVPIKDIIQKIGELFFNLNIERIYLPFWGDIHSDHGIIFRAAYACTKWFRYPKIQSILVYETLSETELACPYEGNQFFPNVFINVAPYLDNKLQAMELYHTEMGNFPFPRSKEAIIAQAKLRGVMCGFEAAESFMLMKEIIF